MEQKSKTVWDLSDDELRNLTASNEATAKQFKSLLEKSINGLYLEIERIESILSGFVQTENALLTVSGLLALFPVASNQEILPYFLIWVFPFLIASVVLFLFASSRIRFTKSAFSVAADGDMEELVFLRNEVNGLRSVWAQLSKSYKTITEVHRLMVISSGLYFLSFLINYYLFIFFTLLCYKYAIILTMLILLLGVWRYWANIKNSKSQSFGNTR